MCHVLHVSTTGVEPARAWALLTAGQGSIFRIYEALMRSSGPGAYYCPELLQEALPTSLPAMQMCYSRPKVAAAAMHAVTTTAKWLNAATSALAPTAATAGGSAPQPGSLAANLASSRGQEPGLLTCAAEAAATLARAAQANFVRAAAWVDPELYTLVAAANYPLGECLTEDVELECEWNEDEARAQQLDVGLFFTNDM